MNASVGNGLLHFTIHAALFVTSIVVWMPVLSPLPEIPRLHWLPRMIYLFLQSIVPTVPAWTDESSNLFRSLTLGPRSSRRADSKAGPE